MTLQLSTTSIDAGVVEGRAEFPFTLANAGVSPVTVTSVDLPRSIEGLVLSGLQPPQTIAPGASLDYTAVVKRVGEEFFSGSWTFSMGTESATITISGERLLLWPYEINWSSPVSITHSFKTDIFRSRSGKEQRVAKRHQPRRTIKSEFLIRKDEWATLKTIGAALSANPVFQPDPTRSTFLTAIATAKSAAIANGTTWAVEGAYILIGEEIARIVSVTGENLILERDLASSHAVGTPVRAGFRGLITNGLSSSAYSDRVVSVDLNIAETPGVSDPEPAGTPITVFDGIEVLSFLPNWLKGVKEVFEWPLDISDSGFGVIDTWRPITFAASIRQTELLLKNAQCDHMLQFFGRMRGQQGEFYCSTGMSDLHLREGFENPSAGVIRAKGQDVYARLRDDTVLRSIEALGPSGFERRKIVEFDKISDGNGEDTLIVLDTTPVTDAAAWKRISFMPLCRFASDDLTLVYLTDSVARVSISVRSIEVKE